MATAVTYTLAKGGSKEAIVRAAGLTADTNIILEVDEDLPVGDIIALLRKVEGRVVEKHGDSTS